MTTEAAAPAPIVLLHGLTDSSACWPLVVDHLAGGARRVVALDARGHGGVPLPDEPFTVGALAADAAAALRALGLGPALVVGHSMGGVTAEALALTAPELVAGLLLEDPAWHDRPGSAEDGADGDGADADGGRADEGGAVEDGARDEHGRPVWLAGVLAGLAGRTVEQVAARGRRDNPRWSETEVDGWARAKTGLDPRLAEVPHDWLERDWVGALAELRVPVTLLTAPPGSGVVSRAQVARAAGLLGTAPAGLLTHVEVPGVGHNIRRDAPEAFLTALDAALARVDGLRVAAGGRA